MSFFTYYGKLKDELLVAILPNGTVEIDDPIHLFSKKQLISYRVRDVSVTEDGEDRVTFHDGYYQFEAVTSKAYKAVSLTRKTISSGEATTVALTRHYDQAQTAASAADRPKVWTGAVSFHGWANNESIIVIAPKGLGNTKPVVALWQWTKDSKGTPKTLSYGVSKQASTTATPEKFSFKQNDYYTLDCQINAATKGLNVTLKDPTNPDKVQKELALAPLSEAGPEHRFTPPQAKQEKVSLECSLPNAKPSLPRITGALPFPADLVETLSYSAAYVDQAGYLAKYAVKQFEKLDRSYHLLEKKAEARATKVVKLEGDVSLLTSEKEALKNQVAELEKQKAKDAADAAKRENDLEEQLRKALAALKASEGKVAILDKENKKLKEYIAKDKLADIARDLEHSQHEKEHRQHEKEDHKAIDLANEALREAQHKYKHLKEELSRKNNKIVELEASLNTVKSQLKCADADILRLKSDLAKEKKEKAAVQTKLDDTLHKLSCAEHDLAHVRTELENTKAELTKKTTELENTKTELETEREKSADLVEKVGDLTRQVNSAKEDVSSYKRQLTTLENGKKAMEQKIQNATQEAAAAEARAGELSQELETMRSRHQTELDTQREEHQKSHHSKSDVKKPTVPAAQP
jgi:hypothetical protein